MEEIIFATKNKGKIKEIQSILNKFNIKSMEEVGIFDDILENGTSFQENAIIKATQIMKKTGKIVLADDSGLEIDFLNKEPGIYSSRYLGENTPYNIKNAKILEKLQNVPYEKRTARFICVMALAIPNNEILTTQGVLEGFIHTKIQGEGGFGYDSIFYIPNLNKTAAQLSIEEKNKISHRGKALLQIKNILKEKFL